MTVLEIGIDNGSALLERMGSDATPGQFLRELTQNSKEAGATEITWDIDWNYYEKEKVMKLCVVDNGGGMDGNEMIQRINKFASSSHKQSLTENFGIGAKLATFPNNPYGTTYLSRKDGINYQIKFEKDSTNGKWGLHKYERPDGSYDFYTNMPDKDMPRIIMERGQGTAVILLGQDFESNTILPPDGVRGGIGNWIIKEINSRFHKIPESISLKVRQFYHNTNVTKPRQWVGIKGNGYFLEKYSTEKGIIETLKGKLRWYIIDKEQQNQRQTGIYTTGGHTGVLYQNEIYDMRDKAKGTRMLNTFGINFNTNRIVIYIEPNKSLGAIPNSPRTELRVDGQSFPWEYFAEQFRNNMPKKISQLEDSVKNESAKIFDQSSIEKNLRKIVPFLKVSRYRPCNNGEFKTIATKSELGGQRTLFGSKMIDQDKVNPKQTNRRSVNGGTRGDIYETMQVNDGKPAKKVATNQLPQFNWLSKSDGSRAMDDDLLEDKAASYNSKTNVINANADFRIFSDTETNLRKFYTSTPSVIPQIPALVRMIYQQHLIETVLMAEQLRGSEHWTGPAVDKLTSEEALTAAVLAKYNILKTVESEISSTNLN